MYETALNFVTDELRPNLMSLIHRGSRHSLINKENINSSPLVAVIKNNMHLRYDFSFHKIHRIKYL